MSQTAERGDAALRAVGVVILNWNGLADTIACLESLTRIETTGLVLTILVVDNASTVDPRITIAERFPAVKVVRAARNLGFAGGCNLGARILLEAGVDYVLFLNNDTSVAPDFLITLVAACEAQPAAGLVAPVICHADQPDRVQAAGGRVALALGYGYHLGDGWPRSRVPATPFASDYLSGACLLVSAPVARRVGLFDERYFAYFEDVDLCLRARAQGFQAICVPQCVIWHRESSSTRRELGEGTTSPMKHYLMARNRILTVRTHGRLWERACFFMVVLPAMAAFFLFAFTVRQRWMKLIWFTLGLLDGLRGQYGTSGPGK